MTDREKVIAGLERCIAFDVDCTATDCPQHGVNKSAVEMAEYCERYEPTYNPEDGSM